ncbi:Sec-independent protein translocase protein TatB [Dongia sedimenti]|uniref:Sec-independent protein translocase protein TatB n=1 Tax=Dongia sedimenti TaxID=3064282 RepID=A0ABU0YJ16_9PROT|nr:Sec-independent protein translocase protein TatB [Rhodospirillaceae bacterium R-7]
MFDLSWGEMGIIAVVALVVLGPKELPNALRTMNMLMKNARKLAGEFQSGVNEIIREADLDEARKKLQEVQSLNKNQIQNAIEKAVDPTGEMKSALTIKDDPTGPARTEIAKPAESTAAIESGEDDAVEIAAAQPVRLPSADPALSEPPSSDPDVTPAPEPVTKEKT